MTIFHVIKHHPVDFLQTQWAAHLPAWVMKEYVAWYDMNPNTDYTIHDIRLKLKALLLEYDPAVHGSQLYGKR